MLHHEGQMVRHRTPMLRRPAGAAGVRQDQREKERGDPLAVAVADRGVVSKAFHAAQHTAVASVKSVQTQDRSFARS